MHKYIFSIFMTISFAAQAFSQNKKDLKISLASGLFNSTYYTNAKPRQFYSLGFDYSITKRHLICTDYTSGQHRYYDNVRVVSAIPLTTPGFEKHTNVDALTSIFSVLYKYKIFVNRKFSINAGTGLGIITETYTYPMNLANGGFTFETSSGKGDLCFPLRIEIDYNLSKHFQIGATGGTYVYPDYPLAGQLLGLRFSYILK